MSETMRVNTASLYINDSSDVSPLEYSMFYSVGRRRIVLGKISQSETVFLIFFIRLMKLMSSSKVTWFQICVSCKTCHRE